MWHFFYNVPVHVFTTISLIKDLCMYLFVVGITVLVMVSKAESIVSIILVKQKQN